MQWTPRGGHVFAAVPRLPRGPSRPRRAAALGLGAAVLPPPAARSRLASVAAAARLDNASGRGRRRDQNNPKEEQERVPAAAGRTRAHLAVLTQTVAEVHPEEGG